MKENTFIASNALGHVPPVPLSPAWPPVWIGGEVAVDSAVTTTEPVDSLTGPCPTCGSAVAWRLPDGRVLCGECRDSEFPIDIVKVVFVDGRGWTDYAIERRHHEHRHDEPDELPAWEDGEPWTDTTATCPKCGTAALWLSMADKLHCQTCEPPRRSERWAAQAELIRRRRHRPVFVVTNAKDGES